MRRNQILVYVTAPIAVLAITLVLANVARAGSKYKTLYSFKGGSDGGGLYGSPTLDAKGPIMALL